MATTGNSVPTLIDITKRLDPDGKTAKIAEMLTQDNEVLADMVWKEGNLPTGERTTVRTGLPSVGFRALNEGVAKSKSQTAQVDEGAAMLEGNSEVDRKLAILSGDIAGYRLSESKAFFEAMNQTMASCVFYGNAALSPKQFTGLTPRYNSLSGISGDNIIDAGGTGTDNASIWLVVWDDDKIAGIYPKGTKAGLHHMDATANKTPADDGYATGDMLYDANGNGYLGYRDHYEWNCGMLVRDWRYAVRIANIDKSLLIADASTGAKLQMLMIEATERVQSLSGRAVFYMPRRIRSMLRQQLVTSKNAFLGISEQGGKATLDFDGVPIRRVDALKADEARVV